MAKETKEERRERVQKSVAKESAARREAYFQAQAEAKAGAAAIAPDLPAADAYKYSYAWRQDVSAPTGEQVLIKNVNPYYDAVTNTILDPATGKRTPATQSMFSGPSRIRADGSVVTDPNTKDPKTGLTLAQTEAAAALAAAKGVNTTLAAALGATIDPKTGKIIASTIDPAKAAAWYASQNPNTSVSTVTPVVTSTSTDLDANTLDQIKSLQAQIASLTANTQQAAIDKTAADAAAKQEKVENAIAVLTDRFTKYGLASLVPKIKQLAISGASESTITLQLQDTDEYKKRFIGNEERIKKGLTVLDPGTYLGLEDRYRQIIRAYGLKQFDNDSYVTQFISNDVSPEEVSSRVVNAVQRVQNADPAVSAMLRQYYNIGVTDMVAYVLDPTNQLPKIERQIGAAEIGVAAGRQGLTAGVNVAEQLAAQGVTEAEARRGYSTIADILPQATKLSQIYTGVLDQYGQAEAEQEVFNTLASAQRKRRALAEREAAEFSGASALSRSSLSSQLGRTY